ncbi:MAG: hypothetical protein DRJ01_04325 [Bacteroidetes bacterium]|nr:MAG: hypothetical protein DRJ01_04325 [Bacteroidota bacterium]
MKKNKTTIIIVIVLFIIAVFFYLTNSYSTIKKELRDFAIEDTASISKIFLVDKENNQVTLERQNNQWIVNQKYIARRDVINLLLKTINRISVKSPVPKAAEQNIIKSLAVKSTKIEIYKDEDLIKTYYVGGPTQDQYGTYMLLENSSKPFIMEIPGFRGYLSTRYFTNIYDWRSQAIFNNSFGSISSVSVNIPSKPNKSFKIINLHNNRFELHDFKDEKVVNFDTLSVKTYLAHFKRINFNKFYSNIEKQKKDSIIASQPEYIITLEDVNGNVKSVKTYKKTSEGHTDRFGNKLKYDPDNMYAVFNNDQDLVFAQYYVFDPIMKNINYFLTKK